MWITASTEKSMTKNDEIIGFLYFCTLLLYAVEDKEIRLFSAKDKEYFFNQKFYWRQIKYLQNIHYLIIQVET